MVSRISVLSVLLSFVFPIAAAETSHSQTQYHEIRLRELDGLDGTGFIARTGHSTIVVGNYLYYDGGEIYYNESGTVVVYPENATYSVDLRSSWTNDSNSLPTYQTDKGYTPLLDNAAFWKDYSNNSFYSYDGALVANSGQRAPSNALWQFIPDGVGSGYWNESTTLSNSAFPSLQRTHGEASAFGNGIGYALGGMNEYNVPTPGLVSYNTTSGAWSNISTSGFTDSGTSMFGQLQYVPGFGPAGLLVAFGGQTSDKTIWTPTQNLLSFQSITIFEPTSNTWASQMVSGSQPPPRTDFCSVGVQGDNGTYEIFIYGGQPQGGHSNPPSDAEMQAALDLDAVYVLSLPAFNWQKANFMPTRSRAGHTCNTIGNRQMVVVGGKQPLIDDSSQITDFWMQGIGVFDMSSMEWKDQYDASAAPYVTPDVVKAWYTEHGRYPASWSNATVGAWFNPTTMNQVSGNITAIAGGVVAGLVCVVLIGVLAWFLLRHRRRPTTKPELRRRSTTLEVQAEAEGYRPEKDTKGAVAYSYEMTPAELSVPWQPMEKKGTKGTVAYPDKMAPAELDGRWQPVEKDGSQVMVHEVFASPKYELP